MKQCIFYVRIVTNTFLNTLDDVHTPKGFRRYYNSSIVIPADFIGSGSLYIISDPRLREDDKKSCVRLSSVVKTLEDTLTS